MNVSQRVWEWLYAAGGWQSSSDIVAGAGVKKTRYAVSQALIRLRRKGAAEFRWEREGNRFHHTVWRALGDETPIDNRVGSTETRAARAEARRRREVEARTARELAKKAAMRERARAAGHLWNVWGASVQPLSEGQLGGDDD